MNSCKRLCIGEFRKLLADEAAAGHGPGDVQAVAPEDLSAEACLANSIEAGDWLAVFVECLELLVDRGSAFGCGEVGLGRAEQCPPRVIKGLEIAEALSLLVSAIVF